MPAIVFSVIFGLGVGLFATQNASPVTVRLGEYVIEEVPLFLVVVVSQLSGLMIAWAFYLVRSVSTTLTAYGRESALKKAKGVVADLEQRLRELETANARSKVDRPAASNLPLGAERFSR